MIPTLTVTACALSIAAQSVEPPTPEPVDPGVAVLDSPRVGSLPGVLLSAFYVWEGFEVVEGSFETNGNLDLTLDVDFEELLGWRGWTGQVHAIASHGDDLAGAVGDFQLASNIEAPETTRLFQAWLDHETSDGFASVRAGLYDITSEFDVIPSGQLFVHSSPGTGAEFAGSGVNGPSTFPVSGLAARLELRPTESLVVRLAAGDGVPGDPLDPASNQVSLSAEDGVVVVGELAWTRARTKLAAGSWGYTTEFERPDGSSSTGSHGAYVFADHPLWSDGNNPDRYLAGFARVGYAEPRNVVVDRFVGGGLVLYAPFHARPDDQLGLAVAAARFAADDQAWETAFEFTYRFELTRWFALQPDLQLILDPGEAGTRDDALLVGLRGLLRL